MDANESIKLIMLGSGGVGKTCISMQFAQGEFTGEYIPTIEDIFELYATIDGKKVSVCIIDTAGQDEFASMRYRYYKEADAYVLVYSIDSPTSVEALSEYLSDCKMVKGKDNFIVIACGNKCDLKNPAERVSTDYVEKKYHDLKGKVIETSAKTGINIKEAYETALREVLIKRGKIARGLNTEEIAENVNPTCSCLLV